MNIKLEELYKKYLKVPIPNKFSFNDVKKILTNEYLAKQIDKPELDFLLAPEEINDYKTSFGFKVRN